MTDRQGLRSGEKVLRKVIITAAITGAAHTPTMSDYLPLTPKQVADDAVQAYEAGAAIVHVHARNPQDGEPSFNLEHFREILTGIKSRCNVVICITTGGAGNHKQRIAVVPEFKPELATLNCGSQSGTAIHVYERLKDRIKYKWEHEHLSREWFVFENTFEMMREYAKIDKDNNTKPELEIWDVGQIGAVDFMLNRRYVDRPIHLQFVLGALSGMQATPGTLVFVYEQAKKILGDFTWSVATAGRDQLSLAAVTLALGGHVRVGLEDSLYAGYGLLAKGSAEQVERVVNIARELSIEPATPDEARQMLGLKGLDKVNF
jgi:uncharacterized protein (DUF849 family)